MHSRPGNQATRKEGQQEALERDAFRTAKESMSNLEYGMVTVIQVFKEYSGEKGYLKKADLKALIHKEMGHFIKKMAKKELDELFAKLDQNSDREIDFKEFVVFMAMVTSACQELLIPFHETTSL
ncbi:protein S100-B-like isoform X2 [Stigmatopora nigra]